MPAEGAAGVAATAALAFAVPFFACFLAPAFFVLLLAVELAVADVLATGALAGLAAGAGVVCAASETPAIANVMVRPMIVEAVLVIVVSVLFGSACLFASDYIDDSVYEPAVKAMLITVHPVYAVRDRSFGLCGATLKVWISDSQSGINARWHVHVPT